MAGMNYLNMPVEVGPNVSRNVVSQGCLLQFSMTRLDFSKVFIGMFQCGESSS